jgi:DNA primase
MNRNAVETIKQKLSIESVVGSYVKLERSGKNFRACCPFHNEKTPSFQVTPDLGIYYCFGCHKGGDIFNFVQEIEGVSFVEARKMLADKAGVSLDEYKNEAPSKTSLLREIMDNAAKHYEVGLRTSKPVVEYLLSRGMTKDTMVAFRIGYAEKGWSNLYEFLKKKRYSDEDLIASGLCIKGPKGTYDRFRERIMFPICDSQGRVIAFTGRVMPGTEEAERPVGKYINSPETELYHKSSVLFAFDKAKSSVHSEGFVIIVEGQMDAVMSHQAGVTNVVALSGTASTDNHMDQLGRFTTNIAICLDGDHAGLVAAQKTAMVAYKHDMKVLVIDIPGSKDPADLIKDHPEEWKNTVKRRKDFITFRLEKMKQNNEISNKVLIAEKELFPILVHINSQIVLDDKLQEIAHAFGSSTVLPIRAEFEKYLEKHPKDALPVASVRSVVPKESIDPMIHLEERMFSILLSLKNDESFPKLLTEFGEVIGSFEERIATISDDDQSQKILQARHLLGELPGALPTYIRTFHDLVIRYQILMIDKEKSLLDIQMTKSQDAEILQKMHALLVRKDALIRNLVNQ